MINKPFDVLAINESRMDETVTDNEVHLAGYTIIRKDRNRQGGGVALYVRSTINYREIRKPKTKTILVGTWYRPPNSSIELFNNFEAILNRLEDTNLEVSLAGDLNCNISSTSPDNSTKLSLQ